MKRPLLSLCIVLCAFGPAVANQLASQAAAAPAGDRTPNLLIIHCDELNYRMLGCYRDVLPPQVAFPWGPRPVPPTPHIDSLARRGALCTSFYATTPVCSPSRAAFVSGRYPHNTPVVTNNIPLDDRIITFAEVLRRSGYATGYAGKWHLDGAGKPQWAPKRRFGFADNRYMFNRGHWKQLEDTPEGPRVKARAPGGKPTYDVEGADAESFTTDFLTSKAIEFIRAHRQEPFCFMVSYPDPHGPNTVRPPYDTMFADVPFHVPPTYHRLPDHRPGWAASQSGMQDLARYAGMVKCIDDNVGRLLETLEELDLSEQTIVVFTADHGDLLGEHHRQNKGVPFETSAGIPFVLCYPGKVPAGTVVREALGCVDFMPTILGLMGRPVPATVEGRDASVLFTTGKAPADWRDVTFVRGTGNQPGWIAAISDRYKLVYSTHDLPWLFDLQSDPEETVNRFADPQYRQVVRELSQALMEYGRCSGDPRLQDARIQADLKWAVSGSGPYRPAFAPEQTPKAGSGKKGGRKTSRRAGHRTSSD